MDQKNNYLYPRLSPSTIIVRRLRLKIDEAINSVAGLAVAAGAVLLIWFLYLQISVLTYTDFQWDNFLVAIHETWQFRLFVVSVIFILFLIYRFGLKASRRHCLRAKTREADIFSALSSGAKVVVEDAYTLAEKLQQAQITPAHLLVALLADPIVKHLCIRLSVDPVAISKMLSRHIRDDQTTTQPQWSEASQQVLSLAYESAQNRSRLAVDTLDLLSSLANTSEVVAEVLNEHEIDANKIQNAVSWFRINEQLVTEYKEYRRLSGFKPKSNMNRAYTAVATPTLDNYSSDLTLLAKYGRLGLCVGRDPEIKAIFDAFASAHSGVLLVGPSGVGKRTIIEGVARLMVKEAVPVFLQDKRLVEVSLTRLISGADSSEAEKSLLNLLDETSRAGNIILFFDNLPKHSSIIPFFL